MNIWVLVVNGLVVFFGCWLMSKLFGGWFWLLVIGCVFFTLMLIGLWLISTLFCFLVGLLPDILGSHDLKKALFWIEKWCAEDAFRGVPQAFQALGEELYPSRFRVDPGRK